MVQHWADKACVDMVHCIWYCSFCTVPSDHIKEGLYRIWCGVNRLCESGVNTLGDTSAFVNPAGQLLLTRRGKTRMDGVGIVFEFYSPSLSVCVPFDLTFASCCFQHSLLSS